MKNLFLALLIVACVGAMILGTAFGLKSDSGLEVPSITTAIETARDFIGQNVAGVNCYVVTYANGTQATICE